MQLWMSICMHMRKHLKCLHWVSSRNLTANLISQLVEVRSVVTRSSGWTFAACTTI